METWCTTDEYWFVGAWRSTAAKMCMRQIKKLQKDKINKKKKYRISEFFQI